MIKKLLFLFLLCIFCHPTYAATDDHIIFNKDNTCKIHYLSPTTKKLWSIQTNNSCPNGWVDGFAAVRVFNTFGDEIETLAGFFKQGYLLDSFINSDIVVSRGNPAPKEQTLTLSIATDNDAETEYLALTSSSLIDDTVYPAFALCKDNSVHILVIHNSPDNFKNTLFQNAMFKHARTEARSLCPKATRLIILGTTNRESDGSDWIFQADMDLQSGHANLRYRPLSANLNGASKPSELRNEQSETLLEIQPQTPGDISMHYGPSDKENHPQHPDTDSSSNLAWDYTQKNYSILDLMLLARIAHQPVHGQAIMHIDSVALDGRAFVDSPISTLLSAAPDLKPGWVRVKGTFSIQDDTLIITPVAITPCTKEWCHEN